MKVEKKKKKKMIHFTYVRLCDNNKTSVDSGTHTIGTVDDRGIEPISSLNIKKHSSFPEILDTTTLEKSIIRDGRKWKSFKLVGAFPAQ